MAGGEGASAVPMDFRAELTQAAKDGQRGDLRLLADEVRGLAWEGEGLRLVAAAQRALGDLEGAQDTLEGSRPAVRGPDGPRVLLFTGHMVDGPDRPRPRFPADQEGSARDHIRAAVADELRAPRGIACGFAGGACGGDILFHEVCAALGIATHVYLALPRDAFVASSVRPGGPQWVERFERLCRRLPVRVLTTDPELVRSESVPSWLRAKPGYNLWQRNNLWMLHNALAAGRESLTLIALWDGEDGDGQGGTGDLARRAGSYGAKRVILNTKTLFGIGAG